MTIQSGTEPASGALLTPRAKQFLLNCRAAATRRTYASDLRLLAAFLARRGRGLEEARFEDALGWKSEMERARDARTLTDDTIARRLAAASGLYLHLVGQGAAADNPFARVTRPVVDANIGRTPAPTRAEVEYLLGTIDTKTVVGKRDFLIVYLLFGAGARLSEVTELRLDRIMFSADYAKIRLRLKGKKVAHWIAVPPDVTRLLSAYMKEGKIESGYLLRPAPKNMRHFVGRSLDAGGLDFREKPISGRAVQKMLRRRARAVGLPLDRWHPHCGRVFAITDASSRGVPLSKISRDVGHASIESTLRYQRGSEDLRDHIAYTARLVPRRTKPS